MAEKQLDTQTFKRDDLLWDFKNIFTHNLSIRLVHGAEYVPATEAVDVVESFGFDFKSQHQPELRFKLSKPESDEAAIIEKGKFEVVISVADFAISHREVVERFSADELLADDGEYKRVQINLGNLRNLGLAAGYEIEVCLRPLMVDVSRKAAFWHSSHVLCRISFVAKTAIQQTLFPMHYSHLSDVQNSELYRLVWTPDAERNVSFSPAEDAIQIHLNREYEQQFKSLERGNAHSKLAIRAIFCAAFREVIQGALLYATISEGADVADEPSPESLHAKMRGLFDQLKYDFDYYAEMMQSDVREDRLQAEQIATQVAQKISDLGLGVEQIFMKSNNRI